MKRLLGCVAITVLLIAFSVYGYFCSQNVSEEISVILSQVTDSFENEDYEKAISLANSAREKWYSLSENTVFVEDTECDNEITMSLAKICEMAEQESDDIYAECSVVKALLRTYVLRQQPIIANIF